MQVRLDTSRIAVGHAENLAGDVIDVPEAEGQRLIASRQAFAVGQACPIEAATTAAPERAARPAPQPRTRNR